MSDTDKKGLWRTPDTCTGSPQSEEYHNRMASGDFRRPTTGTLIQMRLSDQVQHSGLYPAQAKKDKGGAMQQGQLNPDWTEWLMDWPIGWTDLKPMTKEGMDDWRYRVSNCQWNENDPAELPKDDEGYVGRLTEDRTHRADRLMAIGNGQVPLCVVFATEILSSVIGVFNERNKRTDLQKLSEGNEGYVGLHLQRDLREGQG